MLTEIVVIGLFCVLMSVPLVRCAVFHVKEILFYSVNDIYAYFRSRKWDDFRLFGIDLFVGMFGKGKTLTMTHRVRELYEKYGDRLRIISNYKLNGIPYVPLVNFQQLVNLNVSEDPPDPYEGEDDFDYHCRVLRHWFDTYTDSEESKIVGTVVCIDEISSVLSHRNYSNFPLELLGLLCQPRKKSVYIMCTSQRFFMVDKLFRSLTTNVYDCRKVWRFQRFSVFDGWSYENATDSSLLRPLSSGCWFVKDADYESYDTSELIDRNKAEDFMSNEDTLVRKGLESAKIVNSSAFRMSRKAKKLFRNDRKK